MTTLIGLSLTPRPRASDGGGPPSEEPDFVTVSAFSRDRVVFDSGAAVGGTEASVPLSGTATAGRDVEARAVDEDGGQVVGWTRIGGAGADEAWSGTLDVPLTAAWLRPEVRLAGGGAAEAQGTRRFGVGHVIALWGEGALARMVDPGFDGVAGEPLGRVGGSAAHWDRVIGLREPGATGTTGGLTSAADLVETPFEGAAPGGRITLTPDNGPHDYEGVDFTDLQVSVERGARARFTNCRFAESTAGVVSSERMFRGLLNAYDPDTVVTLRRCDFVGRGDGNRGRGRGVAVLPMLFFAPDERPDELGVFGRAARLDVERCRSWGFGADAWKITRGEARLCYFDPPICTDRMPEPHRAGESYDRGAVVTEGDTYTAYAWVCEEDGTTNPPDFTRKDGTPAPGGDAGALIDGWRLINPHADTLHVYNSRWPFRAFGLHINADCRPGAGAAEAVPGAAMIGVNNSVRVANGDDAGALQTGVELVGCYLPRDERPAFAVHFDAPKRYTGERDENDRPVVGPVSGDVELGRIRHCRKGGRERQLVHPGRHGAVVESCARLDGSDGLIHDEVVEAVTADFFTRNAATEAPSLDIGEAADGMVQVAWHDRATPGLGGVRVRHLTHEGGSDEEGPQTAAVRALANALMAARPDERFAVLVHAQEGAGLRALADDSDPSRRWEDEAALHDLGACGGDVGVAVPLWPGELADLGARAGAALLPLISGRDEGGAAVALPGTYDAGGGVEVKADRWLGQLYDGARTRWAPMGAPRVEADRPLRDARTGADGAPDEGLERAEAARLSWRGAIAGPGGRDVFGPVGLAPLTYLSDQADPGHPSGDAEDGLAGLARLAAHAALRTAGITGWVAPVIDGCEWEPTGAHVELWSSAGPITTTRRARALPRPEGSRAHWTEVVGFQVDGRPAERAEITPEGRLRLFHPDGFRRTSVLSFGEGGATGQLGGPEDLAAGLWMDLPIVDVGVARLEGVPLTPLPDPDVLISTLPEGVGPPAVHFTRAVGADALFQAPAPIGPGVSGVTMEMRVRVGEQDGFGTRTLFEVNGLALKLDVESRANKRMLRVTAKDSANATLVNNADTETGVVPDRWTTLRLAALHDADDGRGFVRVSVDGAVVLERTFATTTGAFPSHRRFQVLSGSVRDVAIDLARVAIWAEARPDGGLPDRAPDKLIEGDAAAANVDPWKAGADPFV